MKVLMHELPAWSSESHHLNENCWCKPRLGWSNEIRAHTGEMYRVWIHNDVKRDAVEGK